jgi:hypothetical protein
MIRRILLLGAAVVAFSVAIIVNLAILDLVTMAELRESVGEIVAIVAVSTVALAGIALLIKASAAR